MKYAPFLNYIKNFVILNEKEITFLRSYTNYKKYFKGQYIVQQGEVCKHTNFIISGCTENFYMDQKGQEHIVTFAIENEFVHKAKAKNQLYVTKKYRKQINTQE